MTYKCDRYLKVMLYFVPVMFLVFVYFKNHVSTSYTMVEILESVVDMLPGFIIYDVRALLGSNVNNVFNNNYVVMLTKYLDYIVVVEMFILLKNMFLFFIRFFNGMLSKGGVK